MIDFRQKSHEMLDRLRNISVLEKAFQEIWDEAISEERERTLNSEAVQKMLEFSGHFSRCSKKYLSKHCNCDCGYEEALEKFQQFREGKV